MIRSAALAGADLAAWVALALAEVMLAALSWVVGHHIRPMAAAVVPSIAAPHRVTQQVAIRGMAPSLLKNYNPRGIKVCKDIFGAKAQRLVDMA